ncbi:uncharacterized protein LOC117122146 isoform X2 [Anneissia japonica]|nr:uncharacterized protein LOC117122146 isoform X2 [Anneissia japonica]
MVRSALARISRSKERAIQWQFLSRPSVKGLSQHLGLSKANNDDQFLQQQKFISQISHQSFLTYDDVKVIDSMHGHSNRPLQLIIIAGPALLSLGFCPIVLYMYTPLVSYFWPAEKFPDGVPDVNDAIACFLAPAGLVYATSFGFSYQSALQKQRSLLSNISHESSLLDKLMLMTNQMSLISDKMKGMIYKTIKEEVLSIFLQIQHPEIIKCTSFEIPHSPGQVWKIIDLVKQSIEQDKWCVDRLLLEEILDHILSLNTASSERYEVMTSNIKPFQWIFLEALGFCTFFGVMLLQALSYRMELAMCIMTVFSISILCFVVSDLDSAFNGFFKVSLDSLFGVIDKAERMYILNKEGDKMYRYEQEDDSDSDASYEVVINSAEVIVEN